MSMPPSPSSHPPRGCRRVGHSAVATAAANHHPYHHRPAPSSHRSLGLRRFVAAITLMLLVTGGLIVVEAASFWGTTNTLPQLFQFEHFDKPGTVYSASPHLHAQPDLDDHEDVDRDDDSDLNHH